MYLDMVNVALLGFGGLTAYLLYLNYSYDKELERVDDNMQRIADALNDLINKHNAASSRMESMLEVMMEELDRLEEEEPQDGKDK